MLAQNLGAIQQNSGINAPDTVGGLISLVFKLYIFYAAGLALLVYLILGGFQIMMSRGDPKAMEGGKGKITNAILGFVIVFASYWIMNILSNVFKLESTFFGQIFK